MAPRAGQQGVAEGRKGVGPLIPPWQDSLRPLRQQVFERVRAAGLIPRVQVAKDLGISPASVTTLTLELIEAGLIEEISAPRDGEAGRGRPAVALGVRATAHYIAGMKLSDREHTAVIVDFSGNLIADDAIPRSPGPMALDTILGAIETLLVRVCAKAGMSPAALSGVGIGVPGFVDSAEGLDEEGNGATLGNHLNNTLPSPGCYFGPEGNLGSLVALPAGVVGPARVSKW